MSPWMHGTLLQVQLRDRLGKTNEQTKMAFAADGLRRPDGKAKENNKGSKIIS